ncbi:Crp/Fnr family transcriptional regulator [Denitromonas ohlonensis]|uniref:Crp/Fnr family transcriptional regulator n=2 Tax=Denitromonas TaxID=139331 RepID=A0A557SIP2_9RHOO|nr:Crp/Fnr family transcriptional regulator [Denitromonas ohlonensis]TVO58028.1 Crp/Fnr family transcriptional regulator [Denitromonas halophila]TVO69198.1 Crp/Fnr family transcriptional regulator [Denitromonas ohlonensis]TVO77298.1 Crp/Fnr family transcriptional regulator [Denitromonas ohlonensis]TVT50303.1 MAG: Crp/Fnr family transcriptional regulator [Denitromonas halophila]TVT74974.1 MAG: Crp/Fnr family transcriptional regulator [Denitromonas halophila]
MTRVHLLSQWSGHTDCAKCPVRDSALFSSLAPEQIALVQGSLDDLKIEAKRVLYHQGARSDALYTVREGAIKLVRHGADGSARIVRIIKPGDLAGLEVLSGREYDASAIAIGPVRVCRLPLATLDRLRTIDSGLGQRMLEKAGDALAEAQLWLAELTAGSAPARVRVARLLLRLKTKPGSTEVFRLASSDIAAILGITVETASRVIAAFKRSGVLTPPAAGSYVMTADSDRLMQEAESRAD